MKSLPLFALIAVLFSTTGCLHRPNTLEHLIDDKYVLTDGKEYHERNGFPIVGPVGIVEARKQGDDTLVTATYNWPLYLGRERQEALYDTAGEKKGYTMTDQVLLGLPWWITESTMAGPDKDIAVKDTRIFLGLIASDTEKTTTVKGQKRKIHRAHLALGILTYTREVTEFPNGVPTVVDNDVRLLLGGLFGHGHDERGDYTRWFWFYKNYANPET